MSRILRCLPFCLLLPCIALAQPAAPGVRIDHGWTRVTTKPGSTAPGFLTLHNDGAAPDRLLRVACPVAARTTIRDAADHVVSNLPLRPGETLRLTPGGPHLVLADTHFQFYPRALIPCSATFRDAGTMMIYLHVEPAGAKTYHGISASRNGRT